MRSFFDLREKTLTPAEKKKREEIAKAMEKDEPGMDMSKKMAIATAQAKKVAEEVEQVDELNRSTLSNYMHKASDARKHKDMPTAKVDKRYSGVAKAAKKLDKMNNEEVEQVDELSQNTLRNYHGKSALDIRKKRDQLNKGTLSTAGLKKAQKRVQGINRAANKMEEVELTDDQLYEASDKQAMRLKQLAKSGLVDKSDVDKLMMVIKRMRNGDTLTMAQKDMLIDLVDELVGIVTGDPSIFQKAKKSVGEGKDIEESAVDEAQYKTLPGGKKMRWDDVKKMWTPVKTKFQTEQDKKVNPPFDGPFKKVKSVIPGKQGEGPSTAKHLAKTGLKAFMNKNKK